MATARAKGAEAEKSYMAYLQKLGYVAERAKPEYVHLPGGRTFAKSHDFYGAFDIIALSNQRILFSQITISMQDLKVKRDKIEALPCPKTEAVRYELVHAEKVPHPGRRGKCWLFTVEELRTEPNTLFVDGSKVVSEWGWTNRKNGTVRRIYWDGEDVVSAPV